MLLAPDLDRPRLPVTDGVFDCIDTRLDRRIETLLFRNHNAELTARNPDDAAHDHRKKNGNRHDRRNRFVIVDSGSGIRLVDLRTESRDGRRNRRKSAVHFLLQRVQAALYARHATAERCDRGIMMGERL